MCYVCLSVCLSVRLVRVVTQEADVVESSTLEKFSAHMQGSFEVEKSTVKLDGSHKTKAHYNLLRRTGTLIDCSDLETLLFMRSVT